MGLARSPHWGRFILRLFRFWEPTRDAETVPPQPGGDPGLHGTGIDPPSIQTASSLSLHRLLPHVDNTPRYDPDRFSLRKAPLLYILLILHEPGWLIWAAFIHTTRSDAHPYSLLCLQARTSFVWISSKPLYSLLLNLNPSYYESIPICCHYLLNNRWDSEEI